MVAGGEAVDDLVFPLGIVAACEEYIVGYFIDPISETPGVILESGVIGLESDPRPNSFTGPLTDLPPMPTPLLIDGLFVRAGGGDLALVFPLPLDGCRGYGDGGGLMLTTLEERDMLARVLAAVVLSCDDCPELEKFEDLCMSCGWFAASQYVVWRFISGGWLSGLGISGA
jgi:hypothetical protein